MLVYLTASSVNELATVASRVIRWASAWHRPAFCAVATVRLAWTGREQAQQLWASAQALVRKQVLRLHPATYGDLGRDQGAPLATRGLP